MDPEVFTRQIMNMPHDEFLDMLYRTVEFKRVVKVKGQVINFSWLYGKSPRVK